MNILSNFRKFSKPNLQYRTQQYTTTASKKRVTLLPGEGIGPEITSSVVGIFRAADVPIEWELFEEIFDPLTHKENPHIFQELIASISRNRVALKGPLNTELNTPFSSRNLKLRKYLDLFANIVPCSTIPGLTTRFSDVNIDLVVIRENTQGEYSGFEQEVEAGIVQSLKVITENASRRVAEYAFEYSIKENRKKVTCVHKANIQKATDGLFLRTCREVSKKYPQIIYNEMIVDNCCMQLVMNPSQFDVMLTPNLYGNIITNVGAGLVGGPGLTPGANVGDGVAMFEVGARHAAQDIAGMNKANPTGLILASTMMLRHLNLFDHAKRIEKAVQKTFTEGKYITKDVGGNATTREFTNAVINKL